jgi:hypothetical protein
MSRITPSIEENFEIVSVKPAATPDGMEGDGWHCYEIAQGTNTIIGYRQGSIRPVTEAAQEIVDQLNERRLGKRARAELAKAKSAQAAAKK